MATLLAVHPVLGSSDVEASVRFFASLGFREVFRDTPTRPRYAVVGREAVELHLQWNDLSMVPPGQDRPVYRVLVSDVDALYEEFTAREAPALATADATPWWRPADTPWGTREFHLRDADGNGLQFYQPCRSS